MSQEAGAGQLKRSQNPAYLYGPMVYQYPSDRDGEGERGKPRSNQVVLVLIVVLLAGGVILYLKESGIDFRQLSQKPPSWEKQILWSVSEEQRKSPVLSQARVAVDSLYLREGPGMAYVATYMLPKKWGVSLIGEYQADDYGEVWARVLVQTDQGLQEGWVSRRFLE